MLGLGQFLDDQQLSEVSGGVAPLIIITAGMVAKGISALGTGLAIGWGIG